MSPVPLLSDFSLERIAAELVSVSEIASDDAQAYAEPLTREDADNEWWREDDL